MEDYRTVLLILALLLGVGLLTLAVVLAWRRGLAIDADSPGRRLAVLMRQRPDYMVFVGVPPLTPDRWAAAPRLAGDAVEVEGYGNVPLAEVRAFVVAYANGQFVDCELAELPEPAGLVGFGPQRRREDDVLKDADLEEGRKQSTRSRRSAPREILRLATQ